MKTTQHKVSAAKSFLVWVYLVGLVNNNNSVKNKHMLLEMSAW